MWIQSLEIAQPIEDGVIYFEVSPEQKEYMEKHMWDVDEQFEWRYDAVVDSIEFEPFWNGVEDCFTCEVHYSEIEDEED